MKKNLFLAIFFVLTVNVIKSQITLKGVVMPASLVYDSVPLVLNGAGIRNKYFIDVYVGGLYLKAKSMKEKAIIDADETMAVRLCIISSTVTMDRLAEAIREGFDRSMLGRTQKYRSQIDMAVQIFMSEPVKVGDIYDIWYMPGKGIIAFKNGVNLNITIPGLGFKKAMMGIWLCPNPVDQKLKEGMLGFGQFSQK
jgi:hypothetical protein